MEVLEAAGLGNEGFDTSFDVRGFLGASPSSPLLESLLE